MTAPHVGETGTTYDVVMVGAGIVGLATAYELSLRDPDLRIAVVDKEDRPGAHQSGHNSGVLHSGVYYAPGSLKARLCVDGKRRMTAFAEEHGIAFELSGKLIVATAESELGRLNDLYERGVTNGVPGLEVIGPERIRELEPHAAGIRAVHSPSTGIIDFGGVVTTLARLLAQRGVDVLLGREVLDIVDRGAHQVVHTSRGDLVARGVVTCAGIRADRLARAAKPDVKLVPFRGDYYTLKPHARHLTRSLIYPVPDPTLPFLGVHFTKRWDGEVWAGPNAVLAFARDGYRRRDVNLRDLAETITYPGFRKMAAKHLRSGVMEMWRDLVKPAFVTDLQRYVPEVRSEDLVFGPSGVRAQALDSSGALVDDFVIQTRGRALHVLNAPSPAATASLSIGSLIADRVEEAFELTGRTATSMSPSATEAHPGKEGRP